MPTSLDVLKEKGRRLRIHSIRATTEAGSGHPSSCLSASDLVSVIFFRQMRFNPDEPGNPANDRFVLSKGHAAPLLYAAFAEAGILNADHLTSLRRLDSDLEGHPTPRIPWVDVATGSLGQGLSAALGSALAMQLDGIPAKTYCLLGDGECAEGSVWEAAALASYYKTDNLYAVVDVNGLGQSQHTMDRFDVQRFADKFQAFGWYAVTVDGHDYAAIVDAFEQCNREGGNRPRAIIAKTFKGRGVSMLENQDNWHGKPIPKADVEKALAELSRPFTREDWRREDHSPPESGGVARQPAGWRAGVVPTTPARKLGDSVATREAYGEALAKLAEQNPHIIALDGDTKNSTFSEKVLKTRPRQFLEMFIAEQNMAGVAMGLAARGKIPFASTFAAFLTRAFDQIRMAAVSRSNVKFCGSHCGVSIGEDGPSQMGLEDIAMFRTIANSTVLYPCDAVSTERLVNEAASHTGIVYIRTSRPKTPVIYNNDEQFPIGGSKVVRKSERDRATIVAAGITLHEALKAALTLEAEGIAIRVIDAYSVKPIDQRTLLEAAKATDRRMIVVEDHYEEGGLGDAVLSAVGDQAKVEHLAVREIPRSGPPEALLDKYGINSKHIVAAVRRLL